MYSKNSNLLQYVVIEVINIFTAAMSGVYIISRIVWLREAFENNLKYMQIHNIFERDLLFKVWLRPFF